MAILFSRLPHKGILLCFFLTLWQGERANAEPHQSRKGVNIATCSSPPASNFAGVSPQEIIVNGDSFFIASSTGNSLKGWDRKSGKVFSYPFPFSPAGVCASRDGHYLYLTDGAVNGSVHVFSLQKKKIIKSFPAGYKPEKLVLAKDGISLLVLNRLVNRVSLLNTEKGTLQALSMKREPRVISLSPATGMAAVGNLLPTQPSTASFVSAEVSLFDPAHPEDIKHIGLANGSQSIEGIAFSPDGKYIYVTHLLSRFQYPITQVERGWVNTNVLSFIDAEKKEYKGSILLDSLDRGAANPGGIAVSPDGNPAFIALSGTHELLTLDLKGILERLQQCGWDGKTANDLTFVNDLIKRLALGGLSPRNVTLDGNEACVPCYFSGNAVVVDLPSGKIKEKKELSPPIPLTGARKGEFLFSDASICFQNWQSCVSCHPDGRTDGLNWDQQNDGMGNPKNTKSLLYSHVTPPSMITGIRVSAELAVRKGILHTLFALVSEEEAQAIDTYLKAMRPEPSPYLEKGKLSASATRGKAVYEKAECSLCHSGSYLTDMKSYDVGTGINEYKGFSFDTPTLKEVWRTAPYLYDGRAKNLRAIFVDFNKENMHGQTSTLTERELSDLEQYLLTL